MMTVDNSRIQHYKNLLIGEQEKRKASLYDNKLGMDISLRDATSELSSYDNHPGDLGTETFESEKFMSFRNNDKFVLSEIDLAFKKMENGSYGICEACKKEIDEDRLEILPYSRFCIDCEEVYGQKGTDQEDGRPIEEGVMLPPLGKSFKDFSPEDQVGYDGEDTWQDVNQYNVRTSDNDFGQDDSFGYVQDVDQISNSQYKKQIE